MQFVCQIFVFKEYFAAFFTNIVLIAIFYFYSYVKQL